MDIRAGQVFTDNRLEFLDWNRTVFCYKRNTVTYWWRRKNSFSRFVKQCENCNEKNYSHKNVLYKGIPTYNKRVGNGTINFFSPAKFKVCFQKHQTGSQLFMRCRAKQANQTQIN